MKSLDMDQHIRSTGATIMDKIYIHLEIETSICIQLLLLEKLRKFPNAIATLDAFVRVFCFIEFAKCWGFACRCVRVCIVHGGVGRACVDARAAACWCRSPAKHLAIAWFNRYNSRR